MKKFDKTSHAEKMIMIPESQYCKMLESFDKVVEELEEMKKILKNGDDKKMKCYVTNGSVFIATNIPPSPAKRTVYF